MLWFSVSINFFLICIIAFFVILLKKNNNNRLKIDDYLARVAKYVNSVRFGNLATKIEQNEHPKYINLTESINRLVETLNDREKMITEYQNELTRQNKFLESTINSLSDGILIIDENYKILRATPQISNWLDKKESDIIGKNLLDFIQPASNVKCEKLQQNEIFIKNNSSLNFEATSTKLMLEDKKKRFVVVIKDTTSQKEIEKIKEDFIATLTHDLKVPIVAESNILEFLVNGKFGEINDKQYEAIVNMKTSNQELLELVQILLETYKFQDSCVELHKEDVALTPFVEAIVDDMQPITEKSGLKINISAQVDIKIQADKMQVKRVIKNLIQNAISHSESAEDIDIKIEQNKNIVDIKIIDYGKGISPEDLEKVFNKYYSTAKKFRKIGTGLGLYLSQQIIKSHGGEIIVTSKENVSTEFCIKLPIN